MLSSGCTGWDPNVAELAVADSIMGQWTTIGNPCTGPDADKTFYAQSTYVQQVYGKGNAYIAMFDRWKKKNLEDSRYVWLPLEFGKDGTIATTLARQLGPAYPMGRTRRLLCRQRNIPIEWQAVCHQSRRAALSTYPQSLLGPTHQAMQGTGMNTICLYVFWNSTSLSRECSTSPDRMTWQNSAAYASRTTCMSSCARDRMSVPNGKWADCLVVTQEKRYPPARIRPLTLWSV